MVSLIEEDNIQPSQLQENFPLGILCMFGAVISITIAHVIVKIVSLRSPYISPYDWTLFMGLVITPFNLIFALSTKKSLNILNYGNKAAGLLLLRVIIGLLNNL